MKTYSDMVEKAMDTARDIMVNNMSEKAFVAAASKADIAGLFGRNEINFLQDSGTGATPVQILLDARYILRSNATLLGGNCEGKIGWYNGDDPMCCGNCRA